MKILSGAALVVFLSILGSPVRAESIPPVLLSANNKMPACATPGRFMALLKKRNPALRTQYDEIAVYYTKHGDELNIRWDFAFFQMIMETNSLKFTGDVSWSQNNFAGLGATGGGVKGERFSSVSDGVRAHLEHLLIYAGVRVDNPIAERTRKVQSWGILRKWQNSINGPVTFGQIGAKWAPGDRDYGQDIQSLANIFYSSYCNAPDPNPSLVAQARGTGQQIAARNPEATPTLSDTALSARASLGASTVYRRPDQQQETSPGQGRQVPSARANAADSTSKIDGGIKVINSTTDTSASTAGKPDAEAANASEVRAKVVQQNQKIASAAAAAAADAASNGRSKAGSSKQTSEKNKKCRVWTASYGGQKAVIIRSSDASHINYTVLDVNPEREQEETTAYIAAYAQGGEKIDEFSSQTLALDKAFKLCPEG